SIARHLGARCTGVDISDEAIRFARQLSQDTGIAADFLRADIYDYFEQSEREYAVAFASYGVLCWLSDLAAWGRGIANCLMPGGRFVLVDFHPAFAMFDEQWRLRYDFMGGVVYEFESGVGDYVALTGSAAETKQLQAGVVDFVNPHPGFEYQWGIAEVIMALLGAGLRLTHLREYDHCNGFKPMPDMRELGGRRYAMPSHLPQRIPLMFSLAAEKVV
ncbi:MAG: methyltransferase domain-containing protein, partial [Chloroflexi bacterium]|nr:methyltransferase domain-containing protein [Chloroflexota bacterium]